MLINVRVTPSSGLLQNYTRTCAGGFAGCVRVCARRLCRQGVYDYFIVCV